MTECMYHLTAVHEGTQIIVTAGLGWRARSIQLPTYGKGCGWYIGRFSKNSHGSAVVGVL